MTLLVQRREPGQRRQAERLVAAGRLGRFAVGAERARRVLLPFAAAAEPVADLGGERRARAERQRFLEAA